MPRVAVEKLFLLLMQVAWIDFVQHTKVDAIRNCSIFTSCIDSYADIYKSLTSEENSFNIESALYPAMMPSSLVVKVQIFELNETSVANYTWSVNCLYVAFPAEVLQLLSFGSILITPRMQDLNIRIPNFCKNFSSVKEQKDLMKGVIAAVSVYVCFSVIKFTSVNQINFHCIFLLNRNSWAAVFLYMRALGVYVTEVQP